MLDLQTEVPDGDNFDHQISELFETIYLHYNFDFREYSKASMRRRVSQSLVSMNLVDITSLQKKVISDPATFNNLLQFLTVPVSEMFRDPSYFHFFREKIIPVLRTYPSIKIWVAGCSTGEEVYSFAIILKEEGLLDRTTIYATDINEGSLKKAQSGTIELKYVERCAHNYKKAGGVLEFSEYYKVDLDLAVLDSSLLKNIIFTDHSLATDQVFSEVHFISCRNVLIYFQKKLQERSFGLFYESLCMKGFLGLGSNESLAFSKYFPYFSVAAKRNRIYQKQLI